MALCHKLQSPFYINTPSPLCTRLRCTGSQQNCHWSDAARRQARAHKIAAPCVTPIDWHRNYRVRCRTHTHCRRPTMLRNCASESTDSYPVYMNMHTKLVKSNLYLTPCSVAFGREKRAGGRSNQYIPPYLFERDKIDRANMRPRTTGARLRDTCAVRRFQHVVNIKDKRVCMYGSYTCM